MYWECSSHKLTTVCTFFVGSKLTAGIHKLADSLTKSAKKKTFDRQNTPTSLTENQSEYEIEQVSYVDRQSSEEYLQLNGDDEKKPKEQEVAVQNGGTNDEEEEPEEYLQLVREPSNEEKEVELKVQQKIEALRRGEEASQPVSKHFFVNCNNNIECAKC